MDTYQLSMTPTVLESQLKTHFIYSSLFQMPPHKKKY